MTDYLAMVEDKNKEMGDLWKRMDKDKDLFILKPFALRDKDNNLIPNVNNMTLNDPLTFATHIISTLVSATMQVVVEGEKIKRHIALTIPPDKTKEWAMKAI